MNEDKYRPVKGWAEILFLDKKVDLGSLILPGTLKRSDYTPVGSWIPLEEYVHTFEIVEQFLGDVEGLANIPRKIRAYDVITMCSVDPLSILSVMLVPKKFRPQIHSSMKPQISSNPDYDLMLVNLPTPFDSFRYPGFPWKYIENQIDNEDDTYE
jgi:hypothetical protein